MAADGDPADWLCVSQVEPTDPRLWVFANINKRRKDQGAVQGGGQQAKSRSRKSAAAEKNYLLVERAESVRNALESQYEVASLLVQPAFLEELRPVLRRRSQRTRTQVPGRCEDVAGPHSSIQVFVASAEAIEETTGLCVTDKATLAFAALVRQPTTESLVDAVPASADPSQPLRVLALDGLTDADNVGKLMRVAFALRVGAVLCSAACCDPLHPRAVRASMGLALRLPVLRGDLVSMLAALRSTGVATVAAVVQDGARFMDEFPRGALPKRWALVIGSEHFGVCDDVRRMCDILMKMRMAPGVDSLNAVVAGGVMLYGCVEREGDDAASEAEPNAPLGLEGYRTGGVQITS
eukprot:TRINITY_DN101245_c0_g1_i1.p1 TRINITY_DN101245_c0_g1~~TRINITY_DN101245_c0_g1_i1.p1  ORF type:complete len:373 (+),score=46.30 TRINITY_DN101245_c0_g1_i1:65-1120(+)